MTHLAAIVLALAMVETPNGVPAKPGPHGETGRWQLTPAVRHDRKLDLQLRGNNAPTDEQLATEHVRWLILSLEVRGVDATDFNIALAWNAGLSQACSGRAPEASYDFARRVSATIEEIERTPQRF